MNTATTIKFKFFVSCLVIVLLLVGAGKVSALNLDLSNLDHGEIISNQFFDLGLTVSAENRAQADPDLDVALIFDSARTRTADPDLEDSWDMGNIDSDEVLGNLIIIPENVIDEKNNNTDAAGADGLVDRPDDEGRRPAGSIFFDFDTTYNSFGFDLVDVEGSPEWGDAEGYIAFYMDETEITQLSFESFGQRDGAEFGNNSANRISAITASDFSDLTTLDFDKVELNLGGSGAVTGVNFNTITTVPEPATFLLLGIGLLGIVGIRKRFKR